MSPASKSKSKEKMAAKATKEQVKASSKLLSNPPNGGNGAPASAYNPMSGTFHALDAAASGPLSGPQNVRFRNIDETEEQSGSSLGAGECDSASNNGSCSGESDDPKEKTLTGGVPRADPVPGSDNDKREKIRQKNEKKHQRQKERRAQELHERCSGYLMSRKLELLSQQLVAMGFTSEQATMALIHNEGRLEESVTWLFEGGEESKQQIAANIESGVNLKIDITDELAKITEMEMNFKCTKQEVERAIVACEGDLEKAEKALKTQKQELEIAPQKLQESSELLPGSAFNKIGTPAPNTTLVAQSKGVTTVGVPQLRRDERDLNNTKTMPTGFVLQESMNKSLQSLKKTQPKPEWGRLQIPSPMEKRWLSASTAPSVTYPLSSSLQAPVHQAKSDPRYVLTNNEVKANLQVGTLREPVIVMQRPQSVNAKQNLPSTSLGVSMSSPASAGWYSNGMSGMDMLKTANGGLGHNIPNLGLNGSSAHQFVPQNHFQTFAMGHMESGATGWAGSWNSAGSSTSSLSMPSSLGLFTGWGSSGSSATMPVDWSSGGSTPKDYTSIDWSLDTSLLKASGQSDRPSDTWSTMFMGGRSTRPILNAGVYMSGLQDGSLVTDRRVMDRHVTDPSSGGSHDWTSPFAGKDLLRVPRQFVTSPSL